MHWGMIFFIWDHVAELYLRPEEIFPMMQKKKKHKKTKKEVAFNVRD